MSLQSCEWRGGLGILPFLDRIDDDELHHRGGSVLVTFALTSRCLREYCSGYLRSSSQAAARVRHPLKDALSVDPLIATLPLVGLRAIDQ